jgi:hypothetical protein
MLNLFLALQNLSAAQYLSSPTSREILLSDLYDSVPYLSRTILTSIPLYRFFNKLSDVQPMKISGIQSSPLSPFERHLRQSSTKPPSTRRSSLLPHNKAANRFTTESPWSGPRPGEYAIKLYTFCPHRCEGGSETWLERSTGLAL